MDFVYCLNSSTIQTTPLLQKIRIAGEVGYRAIELWHSDIDAYLRSGGTLEELRRALDDSGLEVPTTIFLKGWWDTRGKVYERAMAEIRRRLEQAAAVGAQFSIAGPPLGLVDLDEGAERYGRLLDVAREFGVRPVFEYLGFAEEVNTIDVALEVLRRCGHPDGTVVLDPFHCFRGGGGMQSIRKLRPEQIAISHFNDAPAFPPRELQHDPDRVMPGDGILDLAEYCRLLAGTGYREWLSLELFNRTYWAEDPVKVARLGLQRMKACVEAAMSDQQDRAQA
ncbi:MAG: sugar phosphate isomerase/epimerase [Planctomycetota bacterium]|nr:MAG: sugar phosphate isomerase/epimerase [Planctomycetota bacterium]